MYKIQGKTKKHLKHAVEQNFCIDFDEISSLSPKHKEAFFHALLEYSINNQESLSSSMPLIFVVLDHQTPAKRFALLDLLFSTLATTKNNNINNTLNVSGLNIFHHLHPLELITTGRKLSELISNQDSYFKDFFVWVLVDLIPHLHSINQKELIYDLFLLNHHPEMHPLILKALTSVFFGLNLENRIELISFFTEMLKKEDEYLACSFIIELLNKVTPALPEKERTVVADQVIPLIYASDTFLVTKALDYFSSTIGLLPNQERFYYTQMIAALINEYSLRKKVVEVIEKAIPFLLHEHEKILCLELLSQFNRERLSLESDIFFVSAYYRQEE